MAFYLRIKTDKGFKMVETTPPDVIDEIRIEQELSATLPEGKSHWLCKLCNKQFPTAGVSAMHFAKNHREHEKHRWRDYVKLNGALS